jgi:hypothetical protein
MTDAGRVKHALEVLESVRQTDPEYRPLRGRMFHYTSLEAFLSIIEHKLLRATALRYLNDASEGALGMARFQEAILQAQRDAKGLDKGFLEHLTTSIESPLLTIGAVYVLCFSEKRDDLSQWRGYTPHGRGISLGLDIEVLVQRMQQFGAGWTFQNCRYGKVAQLTWANAILTRMRRAVSEDTAARLGSERHFAEVINANLQALLQTAALMKNEAFTDEREVRLISPLIGPEDTRVKFRTGRSTIIPYIEFALVARSDERLPFVEVVIGPGPTQALAHEAASYAVERHSFAAAINYHSSPIPYREL